VSPACTRETGVRRQRGIPTLLGLALALVLLCVVPASASAATFKVKSTADAASSGSTSDGACVSVLPGGVCTLRAAIEEANGTPTFDKIDFGGAIRGETITVNNGILGQLPTIAGRVRLNGCSSAPDSRNPCIGLRFGAVLAHDLLDVNADDVIVRGLAFRDSVGIGINYVAGNVGLVVKNNWFGVGLNGASASVALGINLAGQTAQVGGPTRGDRNVFAYGGSGIDVVGDNNVIQGNRFGVEGDGTDAGHTTRAIGVSTASGTKIGGSVSSTAASTKKCDGVCNLVVNSGGHGIDLAGGPPNTKIAGNFIGLSRTGGGDKGNAQNGINAVSGVAPNMQIGGNSSRARNYISGNDEFGIDAGGSVDLVVKRNFFGLSSSGKAVVTNGNAGVGMNGGTANPTLARAAVLFGTNPAEVRRNKFGIGKGGVNLSSGVDALSLFGDNKHIGGDIHDDANVFGNADDNGIDMAYASDNAIEGNYIGTDAGGNDRGNGDQMPSRAGIILVGSSGNPATDNVIGGDAPGTQNVISHNAGDAIMILDLDAGGTVLGNVIGRNTGKNGTGADNLFIDLVPDDGPGNNGTTGPHNGTAPPTITDASRTSAQGTSDTNAVIRLYRTRSPAGSRVLRIEGYLGKVTADGGGNWSRSFAKIPSDERIAATQDSFGDGTSELTVAFAP
jgi:CSLREA domain-containing protein